MAPRKHVMPLHTLKMGESANKQIIADVSSPVDQDIFDQDIIVEHLGFAVTSTKVGGLSVKPETANQVLIYPIIH